MHCKTRVCLDNTYMGKEMKLKKTYDSEFGWEEDLILEAHEVVALQMAGMSDDEIVRQVPEYMMQSIGQSFIELYTEEAKSRLSQFWEQDIELQLRQFVKEHQGRYYVETSATASWLFGKMGAVAVPSRMVRCLLDGEFVVPATDGTRYMHRDQVTPDLSAWKTLYMFDSIELYDKAFDYWYGSMDLRARDRASAVSVIGRLYAQTAEPQLYERFYQCSEAVREARNILASLSDRSDYEEAMLNQYGRYYLEDFAELRVRHVPEWLMPEAGPDFVCWVTRDGDGTLRVFKGEPGWDNEYEENWQGDVICVLTKEDMRFADLQCCEKRMVDHFLYL